MAREQNYLEANPKLLADTLNVDKYQNIVLEGLEKPSHEWIVNYNFAMQKFIKHALILSSYDTLDLGLSVFATNRVYYDKLIYYTVDNSRDVLIPLTRPLSIQSYEESAKSISNTKYVLIIVICVSMAATIVGYGLIVPRVVSVVKHKANVMVTFADIPVPSIRTMITNMHKVSVECMGHSKSDLDENSEVNLQPAAPKVALTKGSEKGKEDSKSIKATEAPLSQVIRTTNVEEPMVRNEDEIMKKKKKILSNSGQGSKRLAIILITCFIFMVLGYFGGSIGIIIVIFNNFDGISGNIRWATLRQFAMAYELFLIRELTILNTTSIETVAEERLNDLYMYERMVQLLKTSSKAVYKNYRSLSEQLDSDQFCAVTFKGSSADQRTCEAFQDGSMARGMQNIIYQVTAYITSVQNSYMQHKYTDYLFQELLEVSNWQLARTFLTHPSLHSEQFLRRCLRTTIERVYG